MGELLHFNTQGSTASS